MSDYAKMSRYLGDFEFALYGEGHPAQVLGRLIPEFILRLRKTRADHRSKRRPRDVFLTSELEEFLTLLFYSLYSLLIEIEILEIDIVEIESVCNNTMKINQAIAEFAVLLLET